MNREKMNIVKRIAIVAQDNRKNELIEWSFHNREVLKRHQIIAAGYTADILEGTLNCPVNKLMTGNLGGYQQIGQMISENKIDAIIFLWDARKVGPFDSDIKTLLRLAEEQEIVIALNQRSADVILASSFLNDVVASESVNPMMEERVVV